MKLKSVTYTISHSTTNTTHDCPHLQPPNAHLKESQPVAFASRFTSTKY